LTVSLQLTDNVDQDVIYCTQLINVLSRRPNAILLVLTNLFENQCHYSRPNNDFKFVRSVHRQ